MFSRLVIDASLAGVRICLDRLTTKTEYIYFNVFWSRLINNHMSTHETEVHKKKKKKMRICAMDTGVGAARICPSFTPLGKSGKNRKTKKGARFRTNGKNSAFIYMPAVFLFQLDLPVISDLWL